MNFREFITKKGTKVLIGKNKEQNETLVKKFKGKNNIIMHTIAPGSPFCIITEKLKIGDKKQVAIVCAKYSRDWRDNKRDVKVHYFSGKDVYKRREMEIGTFGVKKAKVIKVKKRDIVRFENEKTKPNPIRKKRTNR